MKRSERLGKILEIIDNDPIETQEELRDHLERSGIIVTQATLSRDIKQLGLIKIKDSRGRRRYAPSGKPQLRDEGTYKGAFSGGIISVIKARGLIVVKTESGVAMAIAASLDRTDIEGTAGSIAGDDTIFIAISEGADIEDVYKLVRKALGL